MKALAQDDPVTMQARARFKEGVDFYDKVVAPFVEHLRKEAQLPAALQSLDRARRTLRVEQGSQLQQELDELVARIKRGG